MTYINISSAFRATGISPFNPDLILNNLRPTTPPLQITLSLENNESIAIAIYDHNPETVAQISKVIEKYLTNTPARQILTICESLLASNAILFKANSELVANARKLKKPKKNLTTGARYLTKEVAQELRAEATAKETAKRDIAAARASKKSEQAAKKAQDEQARTERQAEQAIAKELRNEWDRLARIYKNYNR
jgi:hypothetical protein